MHNKRPVKPVAIYETPWQGSFSFYLRFSTVTVNRNSLSRRRKRVQHLSACFSHRCFNPLSHLAITLVQWISFLEYTQVHGEREREREREREWPATPHSLPSWCSSPEKMRTSRTRTDIESWVFFQSLLLFYFVQRWKPWDANDRKSDLLSLDDTVYIAGRNI